MIIPEGTRCVLCNELCQYGVIHKVNRRGARPLYVHDTCFEALLPRNRPHRYDGSPIPGLSADVFEAIYDDEEDEDDV